MSSQSKNNGSMKQSDPIPINTAFRHERSRSLSLSTSSSGSSTSPSSEAQTPPSPTFGRVSIPSPGSSPILSYFLSQSSPKTPSAGLTFPLTRKFGQSPVFEEEGAENEVLATTHMRRASAAANRYHNPPTALPEQLHERGAGLMRRLSLSTSTFNKSVVESPTTTLPPSPPPNSAVSSTPKTAPFSRQSKAKRSATVSETPRHRRAPSPMGERILKGHFDGFN